MSNITEGNILSIERGLIVHQCNCRGVMGAGLAKQIKEKWPIVYNSYKKFIKEENGNVSNLLGEVQFIGVTKEIWVANLFGQDNFGRKKDVVYTSYSAHSKAWKMIQLARNTSNVLENVYAPFYIGSGLANGDWKRIHKIAEKYVPDITWIKYKKSFEF